MIRLKLSAAVWLALIIPLAGCASKINELSRAAGAGDTATVKDLLDKGVNPNRQDAEGSTPLIQAAWQDHMEIVRLLLSRGADVNLKSKDGGTALLWAAFEGHTEIVKALLESGANPEAKDNHGYTPLMHTTVMGKTDTAEALLDKGANPDARNEEGKTALILAAENGRPGALEYVSLQEGFNELARVLMPGGYMLHLPVRPSIPSRFLELLFRFKTHPPREVAENTKRHFRIIEDYHFPPLEPIGWTKTAVLAQKL